MIVLWSSVVADLRLARISGARLADVDELIAHRVGDRRRARVGQDITGIEGARLGSATLVTGAHLSSVTTGIESVHVAGVRHLVR